VCVYVLVCVCVCMCVCVCVYVCVCVCVCVCMYVCSQLAFKSILLARAESKFLGKVCTGSIKPDKPDLSNWIYLTNT
jgi:hypothetical protein